MKSIIPIVCAASVLIAGCAQEHTVKTTTTTTTTHAKTVRNEEPEDSYRGQLAASSHYRGTVYRGVQVNTTTAEALARRERVMRNADLLSAYQQSSYTATTNRNTEPMGTTVFGATEGSGAAQTSTIASVAPPSAPVLTEPTEPLITPATARSTALEPVGERIGTAHVTRGRVLPTARPVPGRTGYVYSPYSPNSGYVDVTGLASGSQAKDPYTGRIFVVP